MFRRQDYYTISADTELTTERLSYWMNQHKTDCQRFRYLKDLYEGRHPIQLEPPKPTWKPDNRIICNFAKYIVDTLNGYFIGIPVKTMHPDEIVSEELEQIQHYNDQDDNNSELSKYCSIYGSGFELLYTDETAQICITYASPLECFIIYDDTIARKPLYGVRYYQKSDGETVGSVYTSSMEIPFSDKGGLHYLDAIPHYFAGVPLIEYLENEERQGAFEQVESAITAYEKAISEKANDVDYFARDVAYTYTRPLQAERAGASHHPKRPCDSCSAHRCGNSERDSSGIFAEALCRCNAGELARPLGRPNFYAIYGGKYFG